MKKPFLLLLLGFVAVAALLVFIDYSSAPLPQKVTTTITPVQPEKKPAPEVTLTALEGEKTLRLSDLEDRWVLVNAWATWCPPCVKEMPELLAFAKKHPENFSLVTLSADMKAEDAATFLKMLKGSMQKNIFHAFDKAGKIGREHFQIFYYPESVLVSPDGTIAKKISGILVEEDYQAMEKLMDAQ